MIILNACEDGPTLPMSAARQAGRAGPAIPGRAASETWVRMSIAPPLRAGGRRWCRPGSFRRSRDAWRETIDSNRMPMADRGGVDGPFPSVTMVVPPSVRGPCWPRSLNCQPVDRRGPRCRWGSGPAKRATAGETMPMSLENGSTAWVTQARRPPVDHSGFTSSPTPRRSTTRPLREGARSPRAAGRVTPASPTVPPCPERGADRAFRKRSRGVCPPVVPKTRQVFPEYIIVLIPQTQGLFETYRDVG